MDEATTRKLADDFKVLIDDVEGMVKATASQTGERVRDLRRGLEKKIEDGRNALAERQKAWFQRRGDGETAAKSCLWENTWAGLAIATGLGVLIGLLLRRK